VATLHQQQTGGAGFGRTRWLVLIGLLIAVVVAVVFVLTYTGGGLISCHDPLNRRAFDWWHVLPGYQRLMPSERVLRGGDHQPPS